MCPLSGNEVIGRSIQYLTVEADGSKMYMLNGNEVIGCSIHYLTVEADSSKMYMLNGNEVIGCSSVLPQYRTDSVQNKSDLYGRQQYRRSVGQAGQ